MISGQGFFCVTMWVNHYFVTFILMLAYKNLENSLALEEPGDFYGGAKNLKIANSQTLELKSTGSYRFCIQNG